MKKTLHNVIIGLCVLLITSALSGCSDKQKTLEVTATAYNSVEAQTSAQPFLTAWGYVLKPNDKAIAISRDLIDMGLTNGVKVKIDGLDGEYIVRDKMNKRFTKRIDIYMGLDVKKAKDWGKKQVTISWTPAEPKR